MAQTKGLITFGYHYYRATSIRHVVLTDKQQPEYKNPLSIQKGGNGKVHKETAP